MKPVNQIIGASPYRSSRISFLDVQNKSWDSVIFQQNKAILDFDLNVMQRITQENISNVARLIFSSGFVNSTTISTPNSTTVRLSPSKINFFGTLAKIANPANTPEYIDISCSTFSSSSTSISRVFLWLELWFQEIVSEGTSETFNGGVNSYENKSSFVPYYGGVENTSPVIANDLLDPIFGTETTRRVQVRWRIRQTPGIDLTGYSAGIQPFENASGSLSNTKVFAQGGRVSCQFIGDIATNTLVITTTTSGYLQVGQLITGPNILSGTTITKTPSETGILNTYEISNSHSTLNSQTIFGWFSPEKTFLRADRTTLTNGTNFNTESDTKLFIAGNGTAEDAVLLNTVDGRVYGLAIGTYYLNGASASFSDLRDIISVVNSGTLTVANNIVAGSSQAAQIQLSGSSASASVSVSGTATNADLSLNPKGTGKIVPVGQITAPSATFNTNSSPAYSFASATNSGLFYDNPNISLASAGVTSATFSSSNVVFPLGVSFSSSSGTGKGVAIGSTTLPAGGNLTVSGSGTFGSLSVTGTGTVSGTLTASTGITITQGGVTVTAGGITVTAGNLSVNSGTVTSSGVVTGTAFSANPSSAWGSNVVAGRFLGITANATPSGVTYTTGDFVVDTSAYVRVYNGSSWNYIKPDLTAAFVWTGSHTFQNGIAIDQTTGASKGVAIGSSTIPSAGNLTVSGLGTFGSLSITNNATISGTLSGLTGLTVASGGATISAGNFLVSNGNITSNNIIVGSIFQLSPSIIRYSTNTSGGRYLGTVANQTPTTTITATGSAAVTGSANNWVLTLTYATQSFAPFGVGQSITVSGSTVAAYNGTWTVVSCNTTTVTWLYTGATSPGAATTTYGTISTNATYASGDFVIDTSGYVKIYNGSSWVYAGPNAGAATTWSGLQTITVAPSYSATGSYTQSLLVSAATATLSVTGTYPVAHLSRFEYPTLSASASSTTVTDAASLNVNGVPVKGGTLSNLTLTNSYGIKIDTSVTNSTNAYGIHISAPTGATTNYGLYVASGTSYFNGAVTFNNTINNITLTAPASAATITITAGKTFAVQNSLTFSGTDSTTITFGSAGGTVAYLASPTFTTSIDGSATFAAFASSTSLTLGYSSTATNTTNISTGAITTSNTKTINIGTGGGAGTTAINIGSGNTATTNVTIGTNVSGSTVTINGNLTVTGTTTTISTTDLVVSDKLVVIANGNATDAGADGSGISISSATNKTFTYDNTNTSFTSNQNINIGSGLTYKINGTNVLSGSALGSGITGSSLTSVGTLTTGTWNATVIGATYGGTGVNNGSSTITLGGNFATSGAYALTLTLGASTNVTLPSSGTLSTLSGAELLLNKTLVAPAFSSSTVSASNAISAAGTSTITPTGSVTPTSSNNSYTLTLSYATQALAPFIVGQSIFVSGASAGYNGAWIVTACTTTSVSWVAAAASLPSTATAQGTIASGASYAATGSAAVTGTANNYTLTLNFATQSAAPFSAGQFITISGASPAEYNGTKFVTSCTASSVSWISTVSTSPGTATAYGTISVGYQNPSIILSVAGTQTAATLLGVSATLTLSYTSQPAIPYSPGQLISVTGVTPSEYNGTKMVTACSQTSVNWISTAAVLPAAASAFGSITGVSQALFSDYNVITSTYAAATQSVTLPSATIGRKIIIVNKSPQSVAIFPYSNQYLDSLSINTSITLGSGALLEFFAYSTTQWYSTMNDQTDATKMIGSFNYYIGTTLASSSSANQSLTGITSIDLKYGTSTGKITLSPSDPSTNNYTISFPAISDTVALLSASQTFTNKFLQDSTTTFQDNITATKLGQLDVSGIIFGTGAQFTVNTNASNQISAITATPASAGSNYAVGDVLSIDSPGTPSTKVSITVATINSSGGILTFTSPTLPAGAGYTASQTGSTATTTVVTSAVRVYSVPPRTATLATTADLSSLTGKMIAMAIVFG